MLTTELQHKDWAWLDKDSLTRLLAEHGTWGKVARAIGIDHPYLSLLLLRRGLRTRHNP